MVAFCSPAVERRWRGGRELELQCSSARGVKHSAWSTTLTPSSKERAKRREIEIDREETMIAHSLSLSSTAHATQLAEIINTCIRKITSQREREREISSEDVGRQPIIFDRC